MPVPHKSGGDRIPTDREIAAFEAGIKLGALYHQFVGTPVGIKTAERLERAMSESISLQPYVRDVNVRIDRERISQNVFGYCELSGDMIRAEVHIDYKGESIAALLEWDPEKSYPLMSLL